MEDKNGKYERVRTTMSIRIPTLEGLMQLKTNSRRDYDKVIEYLLKVEKESHTKEKENVHKQKIEV